MGSKIAAGIVAGASVFVLTWLLFDLDVSVSALIGMGVGGFTALIL